MIPSRSTSDDASIAASMSAMDRLAKFNEFVAPLLGSAEACELAIKWKEEGRLPPRLAIAWMSRGLTCKNLEERRWFKRDKNDRVRLMIGGNNKKGHF